MGAKEISLKLLVHREKTQILYAESEQDFVDVLFSFLTMPIGTIIHLTAKQTKIGCMSTLYESLKDLNVKYVQSEACKNLLLHPKSAAEDHCRDLVVTIDDSGPTDYYLCNGSIPFSTHVKHLISTSLSNKLCRCGEKVNWKIQKKKWKKRAGDGDVGVFVKGKTRYMITDDLQVSPVCTRTTLELLKSFNINDASVLEERNVNLGSEEVLHLLKHSLLSKTPLTDVLLPVQDTIDGVALNLKVLGLDSEDIAQFHTEKETGSDSKKISVNLFVSKSRNKVLYAQVGEEFPDLLFSFLAFPLGSMVKCLGGCTSMGCLDNLYRSVEELGNKSCMKSEECKALLLDPKLAPYFGSMNQLIHINELPGQLTIFDCGRCLSNGFGITDGDSGTCSHGGLKIQVEFMNPKFHDVVTELGGTVMDAPKTFMVTDELIVKPLSTISGISLFNQFNIPINDLEERVVSVGNKEALSLLKASLTSKTVLSDVFLQGDETSSSTVYLPFENQVFRWTSKKWSLKQWKYRDNPPPPEITVEFLLVTCEEEFVCEECGYPTIPGSKEDSLMFVEQTYKLHFHKTCFLVVLQENRGLHASQVVINTLGAFWKDVEEYRLQQYFHQQDAIHEEAKEARGTLGLGYQVGYQDA